MASRQASFSSLCSCLQSLQSWQQEMVITVRKKLAFLIEKATILDLKKKTDELFDIIKSWQQEMDSVRKKLAFLIEDKTILDLKNENDELFDVIKSWQQEMNSVRKKLAFLIEDKTILDLTQKNDELFDVIKSWQQEMDSVRKKLAFLIEDKTILDLKNKNDELFDVIWLHVHEADEMLANVKTHRKASSTLYYKKQRNDESIQLERSRYPELQQSIATINNNISQLETNFPKERKAALDRCQKSIKEKYKREIGELQQNINTNKSEIDNTRKHQATIVNSRPERERQLEAEHLGETMLKDATANMQNEKIKWMCFKRSELEKEQAKFKDSLRQQIESELKENSQRKLEMRVSEARLACLEEQKLARQAKIEQILANAKKQWQEEHE